MWGYHQYNKTMFTYHKNRYQYYKKMTDYHQYMYRLYSGRWIEHQPRLMVNFTINKKAIDAPNGKVLYPQISGLENRQVEMKINRAIKQKVENLMQLQREDQYNLVQMEGDYEVELDRADLLSVYFDVFGYSEGAIHGNTLRDSITLDIRTGEEYAFEDLFRPGSNYVNKINTIIKEEIKARDIPLIRPFESIEKNQQYYLTNDDLAIYFQVYQYTSYAYGFLELFIPLREIKDIIALDGPINRLI